VSSSLKYSEAEITALLRNKNDEAFNYLYENYSAAIYGVICRIVISENVAQEVLQNVFVKIWKSIDQYDASKGRLFTWMLNIARNAAIDETRSAQYKQEHKNQSIDDYVNIINANDAVVNKVDHIGLKEVVSQLKPEYRLIIDLLYFKGYTQQEVCDELKIPLGTVKTRTRASLKRLREIMEVVTI
jgi:RNA polymerase sigma-70 factor (ECF subfamily)